MQISVWPEEQLERKATTWFNTLQSPSWTNPPLGDESYKPAEVGHLPAVAQACGVRLWFPIGVEEIVRRIPVVVSAHAADLTLVRAKEGHFHLVVSIKLDCQSKLCRNHCVEATGQDRHTLYWDGGDHNWLPIDLEGDSGITIGDSGTTSALSYPNIGANVSFSSSSSSTYRNSSSLSQVDPDAKDINIHTLNIRDVRVAPSMLIACFHIEVGEQRVVPVTQLGESIGAVAHEVVRLLVKSVIMRVTRHQAGLWKEQREVRHGPA